MSGIWILIGILAAAGLLLASIYNSLVRLRQQVKNGWAQIDVQLKRRYDLIPNLVETVKGYAAHEQQLLEKLVAAREHAVAAQGVHDQAQANDQLSAATNLLMARIEAYPDLKASANFLHLQQELGDTEDRIAAARRFYNGNVRQWNTMLQTFPASIIASQRSYAAAEYFEITDPAERGPVKVSFS